MGQHPALGINHSGSADRVPDGGLNLVQDLKPQIDREHPEKAITRVNRHGHRCQQAQVGATEIRLCPITATARVGVGLAHVPQRVVRRTRTDRSARRR